MIERTELFVMNGIITIRRDLFAAVWQSTMRNTAYNNNNRMQLRACSRCANNVTIPFYGQMKIPFLVIRMAVYGQHQIRIKRINSMLINVHSATFTCMMCVLSVCMCTRLRMRINQQTARRSCFCFFFLLASNVVYFIFSYCTVIIIINIRLIVMT